MRGFASVFKREVKEYFSTPLAYVFLVVFLMLCALLTFMGDFFKMRQASMQVFFSKVPMLFIFLVPAIAMRLWAEERRSNSIELLFSLPITTTQAVLGKYFAALGVLVLAMVLTFPMVMTVTYLGDPDWGPIITGYVGSLLLAGAYLAIGSFFSVLTRSQVIAFVLGVVFCGGFLYLDSTQVMSMLSNIAPMGFVDAMASMSFQARFESIQRGVMELRDLLFFILMIAGWLWANIILLEERRAA
ncbi:MAG: ABC-2 transporter permease [Phycisphaerae bacterium]|jgi:ABC-2 type transport system permease protein|nr:ABC-2 transporter permease [Phycisphaerae bacterium]